MHETTQRRVCRVVFLALCVAPTLLLSVWLVARALPGRHDAVLASLGRQAGCRLTIEQIETPTPDKYRLIGVEFHDAANNHQLATVDWFECRIDRGQVVGHGGELQITNAAALAEGCLVNLLRQDWPAGLRGRFERLTLASSNHPPASWQEVELALSSDPKQGRTLVIEPRSGAGRLVVASTNTDQSPATRVSFNSGDQTIGLLLPDMPLTEAPRFRGQIESELTDGRWTTHLSGQLLEFDPAMLLGSESGLTLSQPLWANISGLKIADGRVQQLQVDVTAKIGSADQQLLLSAIQRLGCQPTPELRQRWHEPRPIAFDRLAFSLHLDASGCQIAAQPLGMLSLGDAPLLQAPVEGTLPLDALLYFVAPDAERFHPATPEAAELAKRLPLGTMQR